MLVKVPLFAHMNTITPTRTLAHIYVRRNTCTHLVMSTHWIPRAVAVERSRSLGVVVLDTNLYCFTRAEPTNLDLASVNTKARLKNIQGETQYQHNYVQLEQTSSTKNLKLIVTPHATITIFAKSAYVSRDNASELGFYYINFRLTI